MTQAQPWVYLSLQLRLLGQEGCTPCLLSVPRPCSLVAAWANIPSDSWKHKAGQKCKAQHTMLSADRGQVAWADTHQGGMWSWVEATYSCSTSWCQEILHTVWPQGTDGFAQLLPRALPTRKHYHKVQMVWLQCHPLRFAQLRLVNKAQNAPWFCTWLGIVRIWHKIVGTDRCVCPPYPSQKGCLMARLASLAMLNVFTQEIRLVIAVLLLVLSVVVL